MAPGINISGEATRQFDIIKQELKHHQVTNKWCRESFHVMNDTVNRDLKQLVEMRQVKLEALGPATRYVAGEALNFPQYSSDNLPILVLYKSTDSHNNRPITFRFTFALHDRFGEAE